MYIHGRSSASTTSTTYPTVTRNLSTETYLLTPDNIPSDAITFRIKYLYYGTFEDTSISTAPTIEIIYSPTIELCSTGTFNTIEAIESSNNKVQITGDGKLTCKQIIEI